MSGPTVLTGIQPTGSLHLGNYFGAIRAFLDLGRSAGQLFFLIADLHSLTSERSRQERERHILETAAGLMALGLENSVLYRQSRIPETCELSWILSSVTPTALLRRAHAYRDKVALGLPSNLGLFSYPVLQAADILITDADLVPVGADQRQHLEITNRLVGKFNRRYGPVLTAPKAVVAGRTGSIPGTDGAKMSKSYGNTIEIFAPIDEVRTSVMSIVTQPRTVKDSKSVDDDVTYALLALFLDENERQEWQDRYERGGLAYFDVKQELFERIMKAFGPVRARRELLLRDPQEVAIVCRSGEERVRETAREVLSRVRAAVGLCPQQLQ